MTGVPGADKTPQGKCAELEVERATLHVVSTNGHSFSILCGTSESFVHKTIAVPATCPNR